MPHQLSLYNTLTRTKEIFVPIDRQNVRMYVCGPTVYDYAHIGNARPVIVFDVLYRLLRHIYGESHVTYVRNITDVDDKINARAAQDFPDLPLNEAIRKVTETTNRQFQADVAALGNLQPSDQPRATEYIDEMVAMIDRLVEREIAYVADGHVLFSPSAMNAAKGPRYGMLARRSADDMLAGARVDVASYKRDEMDFVLWKPSKKDEPGWPSPAGIEGLGRPGWHIECSAMAMAKLLDPFGGGLHCDDPVKNIFDIHAGGIDLVFPHHENEIAQSCCALGTDRMANVWMHNGFLQVEGQKMAKSVGNFVTIHELLETTVFGDRKWPGEVLRLAMLMTSYREPIDFSVRKLEEAENILVKAREYAGDAGAGVIPDEAIDILSDDLATPGLINWLASIRKSRVLDPADYRAVFGLLGIDLSVEAISMELENEIEVKIRNRLSLLAAKSFIEADYIRDELLEKGIQLKDGKDPATGERITTWEVRR
ncbi:cysteine--tRNA ligase [Phyllobacterium sp. A18/5-2]|uniref:cysteine--tRNA ligase n=1 Tax=Phyllobacterium sp. A18/5-2 TaxID=2978392 RepID=UPI000DD8A490|nr:cysteine--tRNA ligase [Phyllobacterium sp. A18/5-2]UXN63594.1 cysteine--tRNA ligase [Phyllobacterium sp. A18/5-2]